MQIEIKGYGDVASRFEDDPIRVEIDDGATVRDVLDALAAEYPWLETADSELRGGLVVMKNGTNVRHLDGLETEIDDGDALALSGSPMAE